VIRSEWPAIQAHRDRGVTQTTTAAAAAAGGARRTAQPPSQCHQLSDTCVMWLSLLLQLVLLCSCPGRCVMDHPSPPQLLNIACCCCCRWVAEYASPPQRDHLLPHSHVTVVAAAAAVLLHWHVDDSVPQPPHSGLWVFEDSKQVLVAAAAAGGGWRSTPAPLRSATGCPTAM
jgi:hypothetical protein